MHLMKAKDTELLAASGRDLKDALCDKISYTATKSHYQPRSQVDKKTPKSTTASKGFIAL